MIHLDCFSGASGSTRLPTLAEALHHSQERLFTRPPLCPVEQAALISSVRATGAALHHLTDTIGPLAFTEFKGEALRDY